MGLNPVNSYTAGVAGSSTSESWSCCALCVRICIAIRSVLCCKRSTIVYPYAPPPLKGDRAVVLTERTVRQDDNLQAETVESSKKSVSTVNEEGQDEQKGPLQTAKIEVRRKSDDPIENMVGSSIRVVQAGREKSQEGLTGSQRLENDEEEILRGDV